MLEPVARAVRAAGAYGARNTWLSSCGTGSGSISAL